MLALEESVISVVAEVCDREPFDLTPESELVADLDMDSAAVLELLLSLEENFEVEIEEDDIIDMVSVRDIQNLIKYMIDAKEKGS